ncbi:MAG TPA: septum formation family protein, partial [Kribbella sp.]
DKLRVGDCVTGVKEGEVQNIKIQPCNQPNGGKVYAVFDLPKGKWPGLTAVQAAAEKGCTDRYRSSNEQADSPSDIFYLHPTQDSWTLGDRGTTCLLTPR